MLTVGKVKFDGQFSEIIPVNIEGRNVDAAVYGLSDFQTFPQLPSTLSEIKRPLEIPVNFLVIGENYKKEILKTSFKVELWCEAGPCKFNSYNQAMDLVTQEDKVKFIISEKIEIAHQEVRLFSTQDPVSNIRKKPFELAKIYRRHIWKGMPKDLFTSTGITQATGTFTCDERKICDSGYRNIILSNKRVESFDFRPSERRLR